MKEYDMYEGEYALCVSLPILRKCFVMFISFRKINGPDLA